METIHNKTLDHKASQFTVPLDLGGCLKYYKALMDLTKLRASQICLKPWNLLEAYVTW